MGLSKVEIEAAVSNEGWQTLRESLKGKPTKEKLKLLHEYLDNYYTESGITTKEVQVLNYLNALSRGGQILPVEQVRGTHLRQLFASKRIRINR